LEAIFIIFRPMVWDILNLKNHLEGEISWLPNEFTLGPTAKATLVYIVRWVFVCWFGLM
jgi:hypothetical protein